MTDDLLFENPEVFMTVQPSSAELLAALQQANGHGTRPQTAADRAVLQQLRNARTTWCGADANALRRRIDRRLARWP